MDIRRACVAHKPHRYATGRFVTLRVTRERRMPGFRPTQDLSGEPASAGALERPMCRNEIRLERVNDSPGIQGIGRFQVRDHLERRDQVRRRHEGCFRCRCQFSRLTLPIVAIPGDFEQNVWL